MIQFNIESVDIYERKETGEIMAAVIRLNDGTSLVSHERKGSVFTFDQSMKGIYHKTMVKTLSVREAFQRHSCGINSVEVANEELIKVGLISETTYINNRM